MTILYYQFFEKSMYKKLKKVLVEGGKYGRLDKIV